MTTTSAAPGARVAPDEATLALIRAARPAGTDAAVAVMALRDLIGSAPGTVTTEQVRRVIEWHAPATDWLVVPAIQGDPLTVTSGSDWPLERAIEFATRPGSTAAWDRNPTGHALKVTCDGHTWWFDAAAPGCGQ